MKRILLLVVIIATSNILSSSFDSNNFPDNEKKISKHIEIKTASEDSIMVVREFWSNPDYVRMELKDTDFIQKEGEKEEESKSILLHSNCSWLSFISSQAIGSWKHGYTSYANQFM